MDIALALFLLDLLILLVLLDQQIVWFEIFVDKPGLVHRIDDVDDADRSAEEPVYIELSMGITQRVRREALAAIVHDQRGIAVVFDESVGRNHAGHMREFIEERPLASHEGDIAWRRRLGRAGLDCYPP